MEANVFARMLSTENDGSVQASIVGKRRKSVSLPLSRPAYFAMEVQTPVQARKGVHFPVSVLLQQAITEGDMTEIKQLVRQYGNGVVEEREPSGLPPVMRAIFEGQTDCLKMLTNAGAELTARDPEGWNVLHVAVAMDDMEAAKYVIATCNEPLTHVRNADGQRPIDLAESPEMARFLLQADLQDLRIETDLSGKTRDIVEDHLLQTVCQHYEANEDCDFLNVMLQSQTEFDSVLHLAAAKNFPRLARYILKHQLVDSNSRDRMGWTSLHVAAYYNSIDVLLLLVQHGASVHTLTNSYEKSSDLTDHELILDILKDEESVVYL